MAGFVAGVCRFPIAYDAGSRAFWVCGHALPIIARGASPYCEEICLDPDARLRRHDRTAALRRERELRPAAVDYEQAITEVNNR
ncbi:hypothetical protein [Nocardia pseudobrasiliensis]|uniref:Uncharacterized protein n=1 Tax=Nocardia pseudobrasiliensis TaxID=45979 RepID=A0A370IFA4_9NOCA|nr:hypothetical protein [Nocardia pseudobrasiliensis]RDI69280.1 hypothetical protein DFR76_101818 [Nocardia pseudobrasiliensis]